MKRVASHLLVFLAFCVLIGLGVWQVQRLKWKTELLAHIAALQTAPPEPIDVVLKRAPEGLDVSFVRVQARCPTLETTPVLRLFGNVQGMMGYRLITACPLAGGGPYGSILVDRGFVAQTGDQPPRPIPGRAVDGPVVGILRAPDPRNFATPENQTGANLWYWRDIPAMARELGAPRPAPVFLMLERPAPANMTPLPSPLPVNIPNNHLGYAITWFGLAAALAGVYLAKLLGPRRST